jgi:hypothetical protein
MQATCIYMRQHGRGMHIMGACTVHACTVHACSLMRACMPTPCASSTRPVPSMVPPPLALDMAPGPRPSTSLMLKTTPTRMYKTTPHCVTPTSVTPTITVPTAGMRGQAWEVGPGLGGGARPGRWGQAWEA